MDNTLKRFFDKIEFNGEDNFNGVTVKKVVINKKKESWDVYLSSSNFSIIFLLCQVLLKYSVIIKSY